VTGQVLPAASALRGLLCCLDYVTRHFGRLMAQSGLPLTRVHDLRHGAATLALASGVEMKVVQDMLGHSSITITIETYTDVLPQVARSVAASRAGKTCNESRGPPRITGLANTT